MDYITLFLEWLPLVFILAAIGSLAGFLAGFMGIGGGIILVPALYYSMSALGYDPQHLMHMAVGTSLAIMAPTGLSSARAHWKKGAVDFSLVKRIGSGILLGVLIGTFMADYFSGEHLRSFFSFALMLLSLIMMSNPARFSVWDEVPPQPWSGITGIIIGMISTLMGIGGAVMNVPYMSLCKVPMHKAIGTASALGLAVSIPGMIGFIFIGWNVDGLPPASLGYINLMAWAIIIPFSVLIAPIGAKLSHSMPTHNLRKIFAFLLFIIATRMLLEVTYG